MAKSIETLMDDIHLLGETQFQLVNDVRDLAKALFPDVTEELKYGGILFSSGVQFAGVFAYQQHVTVEMSHGAKIADNFNLLEGKGKGRRHLKLHAKSDIETKKLAHYLTLVCLAAQSNR